MEMLQGGFIASGERGGELKKALTLTYIMWYAKFTLDKKYASWTRTYTIPMGESHGANSGEAL